MHTQSLRRLTGIVLIIVPVLFTVCFTLLQGMFEYPDILRQPTADVLAKFQAGGPALVTVWYVLTLTALLFVPLSILLHRALATEETPLLLWLATVFGIIAGVAQTLGFIRWPFVVPHLAQAYLDPAASQGQRDAAALVFEAFHRYAGMALGEHLGFLSTSIWTLGVALLLPGRLPLGRPLSLSGIVLALGIAAGLLEPLGWAAAGPINAISYLAWALWLMILGATLLTTTRANARQVAATR